MKIIAIENLELSESKLNSVKDQFESSGHEFIFYKNRPGTIEMILERAKDAEILMLSNIPLNKAIIDACPDLKMISVAFTGTDHIDLEACKERDIRVCNAAGYSTNAVAEIAIGLMISVMRRIPISDFATRSLKTREGFLGYELHGKTVGLIGTGQIGSQVARILKVMGCEVIAYSRSEKDELKKLGVKYLSFEEVLEKSDILSMHVPLTEKTKHMIGKNEILKMKEGCILINTARGPVIDTIAATVALKMGRLGGAGIDVYDMEPPLPQDHPFRELVNTVLLPHLGYATHEAVSKRIDIVIDNVYKWLDNKPQNVVV